MININTASAAQLETLPGMGPITAQNVINYRNEHGPFARIEDITNVSGIGPMLFNLIKDLITVGDDIGYAVALLPDGRIIVAGDSSRNFALARYNSDGSLDTTFDTDGKVTLDFGSGENYGGELALQPDGKIVLAGQTFMFQVGYVFAVARYNSDGSLDTTFDTDGKVTTDFVNSFDDGIAEIAVQSDGKIVAAGVIHLDSTANSDFALVRYNSDGSLDTTFNTDGKVTTDFGSSEDGIFDIAIQQDGRIVATGRTRNGSTADFALARYNSDGSLDTIFDSDGKVTTAIGSGEDYSYAVALQSDGKVVVAGSSNLLGGNDYDFALARYDAAASGVITVSVPGTANPWLAGMPDGTLSHFGDSAPENSPIQIPGLSITPGELLSFSATGLISHGPSSDPLTETSGPDGGTNILAHDFGPENGISDVQAPINALMGVFLGPNQPDLSPTPDALDFSTAASRDYLSLAPQLQQVFFIGDGLTNKGQVQQIVIPAGATRLFVGPMDASQYINNEGFFTVQVYTNSAVVVTIDVKPGRFPNRIELERKVCKADDNLYVAILTSPSFDAQTVNVSSLELGDPLLDRTVSPLRSRIRDVDLDGDKDIALTFSLCKLIRNKALNASSTELVLTGSTSDGLTIMGRDSVKVVR